MAVCLLTRTGLTFYILLTAEIRTENKWISREKMMNVAIIGAGFIAGVHARTILATGNFIHTVVSNIPTQAAEFAVFFNAMEN